MNPKHIRAMKDGKAPLEYLVSTVEDDDAWVHKHGADKYGIRNWRSEAIMASTYVGAMRRHLKAWIEGEDTDPESGKSHLNHLRACCAVVLDSAKFDKLIDDRLVSETKEDKEDVQTNDRSEDAGGDDRDAEADRLADGDCECDWCTRWRARFDANQAPRIGHPVRHPDYRPDWKGSFRLKD